MSFKKFLHSLIIITCFLAVIIAGVFWNNANEVKGAPSPVPAGSVVVTDYAWSDTIGWIQFDPSFGGVFYNTTSGQLSGYAWSDNVGWISFESNLAASGGVGGKAAKANTTTGFVLGWARACAGTVNNPPNQDLPGDCTSMTSRIDGWDGWIKFDTDMFNPVKIDLSNGLTRGEFTGYAWGSDVVGWVSFNCSNAGTCGTSSYKVKANLGAASENGSCITYPGTYNTQPAIDSASGCTAGTYADSLDTPTEWKWSCDGLRGGTDASCGAAKSTSARGKWKWIEF